ncbi:MAG: hypothetical protein ACRDXX_07060 [Stackebrandtia sp.]
MATRADEYPLEASDEVRAELTRLLEETYSTPTVTKRAFELGVAPPDDRDGWTLAYAYGPNGEDLGLVWSEPSFPED